MAKKEIFVFGSNLAGRHGAGSAKEALLKHGAVYGYPVGPQGSSYAIPTKDRQLRVLPLGEIEHHVHVFLVYAGQNPELDFHVVAIGCGLVGYTPQQIAPFFAGFPENVALPPEFVQVLLKEHSL